MMPFIKLFEHLKIQLEAIKSATNNFADDNCIGKGGFGKVYKGELLLSNADQTIIVAIKRLDRQLEFWKEIIMLSQYKHENIVSLLGFCDESEEKILVYEYASKGSLDMYLSNDDLTWIPRLNICIGAACGLAYLHDPGCWSQQRVLHRDIKSSNILLDENWNSKISDLGLSKFGPANQQYTFLISNAVGTFGYCDPLYLDTGFLTKESDVYSFGVVLFEILCGRLCIGNSDDTRRPLTGLVRQYYKANKINELVYSHIQDEITPKSLDAFTAIAYQCLRKGHEGRPLMTQVVSMLENALEYQLEAIKSATNNFADDNCIGKGGFGKVYKGGLLSNADQTIIVAIKRLDRRFGQGNPEFWKEIIMLSQYKHDNIVSLLGFCDESEEKILVYEYASKGSLDMFLSNDNLTWIPRLTICIGAARGLAYLHNPGGTQQRVLHRDIKSSNILLEENWNARISDLGLSKFGPANQLYTFLVSHTVGTVGYCDPLYAETGLLTKESDVYSFGVVLFEVLCGRLSICNSNDKRRPLTGLVREYYKQNKINEIIYSKLQDEINPKSLTAFTTIAYQCLSRDCKKRPLMTQVVSMLETALECQVSGPDKTGGLMSVSFGVPDMVIWNPPPKKWTYTKVYKSGTLGISIDITAYSGYEELREDLARRFGLEGQLEGGQQDDWRLVYVDYENDILIVGDDPWEEFVACVQCIRILSPQEAHKQL